MQETDKDMPESVSSTGSPDSDSEFSRMLSSNSVPRGSRSRMNST